MFSVCVCYSNMKTTGSENNSWGKRQQDEVKPMLANNGLVPKENGERKA